MWANKFKSEDLKRLVKVFMILMVVFGLAKTFNKAEGITEAEYQDKLAGIHMLKYTQIFLETIPDSSFNKNEIRTDVLDVIKRETPLVSTENMDDFRELKNYIEVDNYKETRKLFNELLPKYVDEKNRDKFNKLHEATNKKEYQDKVDEIIKK